MHISLIIFVLHFVVMMKTTPPQSDSVPRLISFNAQRLEYNESMFYELNCSSSRRNMGNGAEFIIDGETVEHIAYHENKCYDSKLEECTLDHCQCIPSENVFIHKHKYSNTHTERIIGCQMRFAHNETGDVIKAVSSIRINKTEMQIHGYDVKILKKHKEKKREDENKTSFQEKLTKWMPVLFGLMLMMIACFIVVLWCHNHTKKKRRHLTLRLASTVDIPDFKKTEERYRYFLYSTNK